jgi:pimeloyl-ACP methyl ester carboxylesterase
MSSDVYVPDPQATVDGVTIDLRRKGAGRPLLFLQALEGWIRDERYTDLLAKQFDVLLPQHPGFGHSELPREFANIADYAYFYLSMLDELDLDDVVLVGSSFGGWIAQEMAVRSTRRLAALVLVDAFGYKPGGRDDRDIVDIYALSQAEVAERFYHDPQANRRDITQLPDHVLESIARSRETMCFIGWQPYMHNPGLRRWLRRIRIPALVVWGESDGIVSPTYGRGLAAELPDGRFVAIPKAGHYPHLEQPEAFAETIAGFVDSIGAPARRSA